MKIKYPSLLLTFLVLVAFSLNIRLGYAQAGAENIKLNQLGFFPYGSKVVVITAQEPTQNFYWL